MERQLTEGHIAHDERANNQLQLNISIARYSLQQDFGIRGEGGGQMRPPPQQHQQQQPYHPVDNHPVILQVAQLHSRNLATLI